MITEIKNFRNKYPDYGDLDDLTLATKLATKFPEYSDLPDKVKGELVKPPGKPTLSIRDQMQANREEYQKEFFPGKEDVLKYGGAIVGGLVGAPFGPAGVAAGGTLGYGIGSELSKIGKPRTTKEAFTEAGKALESGAMLEMGAPVMGKGIEAAGKGLSKLAPRVYESVLKAPPGSVSLAQRKSAVETALEGKYAPTEGGLKKLQGDIDGINKEISAVIDKAAYSGKTVDMKDVVKRVDELKDFYNVLPPGRSKTFIDELSDIQSQYLTGGSISVKDAQVMKQRIYQLHRKHYGELKSVVVEGEKAVARGLKEELVNQVPEIAQLNAKDSARIELEKVLERAVKRSRNWDLIGLTDIVGGATGGVIGGHEGGWEGGGKGAALGLLVTRALRDPAVASRLAFALSKAKVTKGLGISRPLVYEITKESQ